MSTSEPFMPFHEPAAEPDPRERDIDGDADVVPVRETSSPEEIAAAEAEWARAPKPAFRTPTPGARLTADELGDDLDA